MTIIDPTNPTLICLREESQLLYLKNVQIQVPISAQRQTLSKTSQNEMLLMTVCDCSCGANENGPDLSLWSTWTASKHLPTALTKCQTKPAVMTLTDSNWFLGGTLNINSVKVLFGRQLLL